MFLGPVNWLAIIVATAVSMALGAGWYMVLGNQWMGALGKTREQIEAQGNPAIPLAFAAVTQLVMAYFLALLTPKALGASTLANGVQMGFWLWLGFVITSLIIGHRYQGAKWSLTLIDGGYLLGVLLVQGIVIGLFG